MIKTFIDVTEPITNTNWANPDHFRELEFVKRGVTLKANYMNLGKGFTTITYGANNEPAGYYDKSVTIGEAMILDLSFIEAKTKITKEMLETALGVLPAEETLIVKTCWGLCHDFYSADHVENAPKMTREAAEYLISLAPKNVAFDFPISAHTLRDLTAAGVNVIEGLNFLWKFDTKRVEFYAMTMNLVNLDLPTEKIRVVIAY